MMKGLSLGSLDKVLFWGLQPKSLHRWVQWGEWIAWEPVYELKLCSVKWAEGCFNSSETGDYTPG